MREMAKLRPADGEPMMGSAPVPATVSCEPSVLLASAGEVPEPPPPPAAAAPVCPCAEACPRPMPRPACPSPGGPSGDNVLPSAPTTAPPTPPCGGVPNAPCGPCCAMGGNRPLRWTGASGPCGSCLRGTTGVPSGDRTRKSSAHCQDSKRAMNMQPVGADTQAIDRVPSSSSAAVR